MAAAKCAPKGKGKGKSGKPTKKGKPAKGSFFGKFATADKKGSKNW